MSKNLKNPEGYIINTNTGIMHTKQCADGEVGVEPVDAGRRKHHSTYNSGKRDNIYVKDHRNEDCIG